MARHCSDIASTKPPEVPIIASLPGADPSTRPVLKPELHDYVCLNFVKNDSSKLKADDHATPAEPERGLSEPSVATRPAGVSQGRRGIKKRVQDDLHRADGNDSTEDEAEKVWRESAIRLKSDRLTSKKSSDWRGGENASSEKHRPLQSGDSLSENDTGTADRDDVVVAAAVAATEDDDDDDESKLYTRTLGSSVSVMDEKDAVKRNGGARFGGEDPIRERLRGTDPFLWMSRLHAGAAAISVLIDTAKNTLMTELNDSSTNETASAPGSIASDQSAQGEVTLAAADLYTASPFVFAVFVLAKVGA